MGLKVSSLDLLDFQNLANLLMNGQPVLATGNRQLVTGNW